MKVEIKYKYEWEGVVEIDDAKSVEDAKRIFYDVVGAGDLDIYCPKEFPAGGHVITEIKEVKDD